LVSELKYHSLFESMTDGFASVDIGGRIVEFNKAFSKIIGYVSEEIRDLTYETITPEEWHAFEKNIIETQVMVRGYSDLYEKEYRCKDGSILPIELRTYLSRDHNAIPTGMWAIIRDVSERKRSESEKLALKQLLHQAQKLESLGVLAGGIAHDFNNILAIIMGYCSLGQMKPEMAAGFMPEIEKASERAATLCRQMLAYAGKTQIIKCSINLEEVLDDTLGILKSTLPKNVAIKHTIEGGIPKILAEDKQIKQIIMDLLINAAEAIGEEQGEILVAMTKTEFIQGHKEMDHLGKTIVPGVYLCLEVTDNGCGMDDETKRRIFDPFFSTKFAGRGLAMSAVLGFVASYEGALQLTSQVGHGTTVKIYLPSPPGCSGAETAKMTDSAPWQGTGLILLVDDEPQIIEVSRAMLEKIGFSVIEATNGIEALEQYRKRSAEIRIVVTDIGMPQMGGYELVHELKKLDPKLPIIVSSGFGDTAVTSRISPGDIAGLISKPYKFDQLRDVLMNVVEGATESIRDVK
jgi:PAS domain S-box-containing protein